MIEHVFLYDRDDDSITMLPGYVADRRYRDTDAGTQDQFVVQAPDKALALDAARRWVANRADEDEPNVPDDLALVEREWTPGKTYMALELL